MEKWNNVPHQNWSILNCYKISFLCFGRTKLHFNIMQNEYININGAVLGLCVFLINIRM